jgi:hypothetical protein
MPGILIFAIVVTVLVLWATHILSKQPVNSKEEQEENFKKYLELPPF